MSKMIKISTYRWAASAVGVITAILVLLIMYPLYDSERSKRRGLQTTLETIYKYHPELLESHSHLSISIREKATASFDSGEVVDSIVFTYRAVPDSLLAVPPKSKTTVIYENSRDNYIEHPDTVIITLDSSEVTE